MFQAEVMDKRKKLILAINHVLQTGTCPEIEPAHPSEPAILAIKHLQDGLSKHWEAIAFRGI